MQKHLDEKKETEQANQFAQGFPGWFVCFVSFCTSRCSGVPYELSAVSQRVLGWCCLFATLHQRL